MTALKNPLTSAPNPLESAWRPTDPPMTRLNADSATSSRDIIGVVESTIDSLDADLRQLSLDIHDHPELSYQEHHAHDVLTDFMERRGFEVTRHYLLETGWKATYTHKSSKSNAAGRTLGVNSEMDALPGVGHACGHNLIAIAGLAVAIAAKEAIQRFDINGTILLLGTPAEEDGNGKVTLLDEGAYKDMAVCLMCHPSPGPQHSVSLSSSLALTHIDIEYSGHSAHAGLSPWEGVNALDAAVLAYNNISVLRQQVKPTHRFHGVFEGNDWAANIIPDNSAMHWLIRAPTRAETDALVKRVTPCFQAASLATGCTMKMNTPSSIYDLRQNKALGDHLASIYKSRYGSVNYGWGIASASTDFGNVTYALPALHPNFAIPTLPNGANHTPEFTKAARTPEAHAACLDISKALAATGVKVLADDKFYEKVCSAFEEDKKKRDEEFKLANL